MDDGIYWRVEPDVERDTRPVDTYDVIDDSGLPVAGILANFTFVVATAIVDAHNAAVDAAIDQAVREEHPL
jgi:hypothetical protein